MLLGSPCFFHDLKLDFCILLMSVSLLYCEQHKLGMVSVLLITIFSVPIRWHVVGIQQIFIICLSGWAELFSGDEGFIFKTRMLLS